MSGHVHISGLSSLLFCHVQSCICSPARSNLERSLSLEDSLDPDAMDSGTLPVASSPKDMDGAEASSRRIPGPRENLEAIREAPKGESSAAGHMEEQTPWILTMGAVSNSAPN